ncbi:MAG: phage tail protein [Oscillospiraceae bacterium]|nr:phage tail protein [Oscillospiraceae bacterium]
MAQVGVLGDIIFTVSSKKILTHNNAQWSGSARYTEHQRHLKKSLAEFTGEDADKASLNIQLRREAGVDVTAEIKRIQRYKKNGTTLVLIIGTEQIGEYRWVIRGFRVSVRHTDGAGNLLGADVSLDLLEYLRE